MKVGRAEIVGLSELAAFEAAYQVLQPLDEASRRRALQWLSDALGESKPLSRSAGDATVAAASETRGRRAASQPLNGARGGKAVKEAPGRRGRRPGKVKQGGERSYRRMPAAEEVM